MKLSNVVWKDQNKECSAVYKNGMELFQVKNNNGNYKFIMFTKNKKRINVECKENGIKNILNYF